MVLIAQMLETLTWGNTHRSPDRRMLRPRKGARLDPRLQAGRRSVSGTSACKPSGSRRLTRTSLISHPPTMAISGTAIHAPREFQFRSVERAFAGID